ncbi:MAG: hypothetical protein LAO55_01335 [Acidobacteriia bacterium]|nr:hypothetical protein [Terriglobia bacterium]
MLLLPETVVRQDGIGAAIAVEARVIRLTLGITRSIPQENLEVSVWGSPDGQHWRPLVVFPQKFYCGTYPMLLDLTSCADVQHLRAEWKMGRWAHHERAPLFEFYLRAEDGLVNQMGQVAANAVR